MPFHLHASILLVKIVNIANYVSGTRIWRVDLSECKNQNWKLYVSEAKVAQLCQTLCDPMDYSPPGSSVHGILQARVLEWVAMPSSKESFQPRDRTKVSHIAGRFFTIWDTREARWVFVPVLVICQVWRSLTEEKFSKRKDITTWDRYTVIVPSLPRGPVSIFIGNCAEMRGAQ